MKNIVYLTVAWLALNAIDIIVTLQGGKEVNPMYSWMDSSTIPLFIVMKMALSAVVVLILWKLSRLKLLRVLVPLMVLVVLWNVGMLV